MSAARVGQFDVFTATFCPQRVDDLNDYAREAVGTTREWMAAWMIEEGPYEGQWACTLHEMADPIGWVPECDLERLQ